MGRKSSWRNPPLKSVSFPTIQESFLRELAKAIDSTSSETFQRFILDKDGATISISVKLSLLRAESNEPIADTPIDIAVELPEGIEITLSNEFTPSILRGTHKIGDSLPLAEMEELDIHADLPEYMEAFEEPSLEPEFEDLITLVEPDLEIEAPIASDVVNDFIPAETPANLTIRHLHPTPPSPEDLYLNPPLQPIKTTVPFVDQLYIAWLESLSAEDRSGEALWGKPVLLEHLYQQHFSAILGMTFLRKVEQAINNTGSGLHLHINLGGSETYKLKNGLTLEGISFSHAPRAQLEGVLPGSGNSTARTLATIALSVIGTCVIASSVLALMPGNTFKGGTIQRSAPISK